MMMIIRLLGVLHYDYDALFCITPNTWNSSWSKPPLVGIFIPMMMIVVEMMFESGGDNGHVIMMIRLFEMPSKKCKFGGYSQRGGTSFPQFG